MDAANIRNGIPLINGTEYSWGDIATCINGVPVSGITAISYGEKQDVQNNYGAGRYPVSRSKGRIEATAKITLYMSEVVAICRNALLPYNTRDWKEGDLNQQVELELIVSHIEYGKPDGV